MASTSPIFLQCGRLGVISEIKVPDWSLLASQKAKGLNPVSIEGNSKFRGSSNVWNEG